MSAKSERRTVTAKLGDIRTNLFVRKELNEDRVFYLAELMAAGVKMKDNILVTPDLELIEGRHRKEAYELNGIAEVEVDIEPVANEVDLIAKAYRANIGGSLPPTQADTEHTVMLLLERGETKKRIGELLGLPASVARRYVNEVQSKTMRAKLLRAVTAVTDDGLTVAKAAEQHGVDADKLREALSGRRRKQKHGVAELQRALTQTYKSVGAKNAAAMRNLLEKYEDGDVNEKQTREIFAHLENLQKQSARAVADWKKRFEGMRDGKTAKVAVAN